MYISTGNEIIQLQASTGDHLATRVLFNGLEEAEDLDVDRYHNFVYWVDTVLRTINRASVLDHNTILTNNYETVCVLIHIFYCISMICLLVVDK